MSAGICGKRAGFDDICGSPTSSQAHSAKRSRCSPFGSPTHCSDLGFGYEDKLSILLQMFPSIDRNVVESILDSHDHKIEDAIRNLHALCISNECASVESISCNGAVLSNENVIEGDTRNPATEQATIETQDENSENFSVLQNGSSVADLFVQEISCASGWEDVRGRTIKFLEAFERSVRANSVKSKAEEVAVLKEQLQCLLRDNHVLKKGIHIQHERTVQQEEKLKELPTLKHFISQCQEQIRKLEMDNYTLRIHLQRAQDSNSMPSHYHRDIF